MVAHEGTAKIPVLETGNGIVFSVRWNMTYPSFIWGCTVLWVVTNPLWASLACLGTDEIMLLCLIRDSWTNSGI